MNMNNASTVSSVTSTVTVDWSARAVDFVVCRPGASLG